MFTKLTDTSKAAIFSVLGFSDNMDSGDDATWWPTDAEIDEALAKMRGEALFPACGYPT